MRRLLGGQDGDKSIYLCDQDGNKVAYPVMSIVPDDFWYDENGNLIWVENDSISLNRQYYWQGLPVVPMDDVAKMKKFGLSMYDEALRDSLCVFVEYFRDGRMWHCVALASKQTSFGADNYKERRFRDRDKVYCLNLTTMQVESFVPKELGYCDFYDFKITEQEYEIYKYHYDKNKHQFDLENR